MKFVHPAQELEITGGTLTGQAGLFVPSEAIASGENMLTRVGRFVDGGGRFGPAINVLRMK
jgi:hypothetical protein